MPLIKLLCKGYATKDGDRMFRMEEGMGNLFWQVA